MLGELRLGPLFYAAGIVRVAEARVNANQARPERLAVSRGPGQLGW